MKITVVKSNHLYSNSKFNKPSCILWPENNKLTCWDKLYEQYNIKMLVCEKAKLTICLRYRIISFPFDTKHYQLLQYLYYPGKDFKLTAALFRSKVTDPAFEEIAIHFLNISLISWVIEGQRVLRFLFSLFIIIPEGKKLKRFRSMILETY